MLVAPRPQPSPDQIPGSVTQCTNGHCTVQCWSGTGLGSPPPLSDRAVISEINGNWTVAGWGHVAHGALLIGLIGLSAATVFRLLAVRSAQRAEPSRPERAFRSMGASRLGQSPLP
jgi:hypothetical protein